jgi:uncharacterized protein (DUF2267 family)
MSRAHAATVARAFQYADDWRYERFVTTIEQLAGLPWNAAERVAQATLQTLGERISGAEARELAGELPGELRGWLLDASERHENFDAEEFVRRVAEREQTDMQTAERHARVALTALARLVRGDELDRLAARLPDEYARLLGEAKKRRRDPAAPAVVVGDVFVERVARRAALEPSDARHASEALIETLAERLAGGEVDDLAEQLPEDLHPALERGKARTGGKAQRISLDEFIARVAEREGLTWEQALEHARAVFAALRDSLSQKELSDLLAELPRGYREALL